MKGLSEQLDEDVAQLDELAAMFGNKAITSAEWTAAAAPIRARVADNERILAAAQPGADTLKGLKVNDLREQWDTLPIAQQKAIVSAVAESIVIVKSRNIGGGRLNPERVQITWKG